VDSHAESILTPFSNAKKTIIDGLAGIFSQSFSNFEVLVKDGGAVDKFVHLV
jgi:hypothetical protein